MHGAGRWQPIGGLPTSPASRSFGPTARERNASTCSAGFTAASTRRIGAPWCERFVFDPGKRVREYSKGNRQKIMLIAALATRAELLILDEPTSGLDPLMEAAFRETVGEATASGQTVFLSSHILSEVEALCDRVGILREGRLIEEGTLAELRHLSQTVVEATFTDRPPDIPAIAGVTATPTGTTSLRFTVKGPIGPLIDSLAGTSVVSLSSREPSLEELFLAQYDQPAARTDAPAG